MSKRPEIVDDLMAESYTADEYIEALEKDAALARYILSHWSRVRFQRNADNSTKSIDLTIVVGRPRQAQGGVLEAELRSLVAIDAALAASEQAS